MDEFDDIKINNAVHECLDRCYRASGILPIIAEFLNELRVTDDWQRSELVEVELAVHKVLHGVIAVCELDEDGILHDSNDATMGDS